MDTNLIDLILDNLNKLFNPEDWLAADLSMSKTEIFALFLVDRHGEIIMSQLAGSINVPMSTATGIIERLVKNGYMKRERSESDRRIVAIKLTDKGKNMVDQLKGTILKYIKLISESLTEEEKQLIFKVFLKVLDLLERNNVENIKETSAENTITKIDIE